MTTDHLMNNYIYISVTDDNDYICARDMTGNRDHRFDTKRAKTKKAIKNIETAWNELESIFSNNTTFEQAREVISKSVATYYFLRE